MQIMRHAGLTRFLFATAFALTLAEGLANTSEQTDLTARSGGSGRCSKDSEDRRCAPKNLSYSIPAPFLVGQAIMPLKPTVTGIVLRYRVSPQLPIGLVISHTSGIISGSPTATTPPRTYVITASNEAGRTSLQLTLSVLASAPPSALSYSPTAPFLIRKAISPVVPTVIGTATTYVVVPGLPAGIC